MPHWPSVAGQLYSKAEDIMDDNGNLVKYREKFGATGIDASYVEVSDVQKKDKKISRGKWLGGGKDFGRIADNSAGIIHMMVFNETSEAVLLQSDCLCDFWNSLDYRF